MDSVIKLQIIKILINNHFKYSIIFGLIRAALVNIILKGY